MNDKNISENFSVAQYFEDIVKDDVKKFDTILQWSEEDKVAFKFLIKELDVPSETTKQTGDKLENIVEFIIRKTFFFEVYKNVRTTTNEIDEVIVLSKLGKQALHKFNLSRDLISIPNDIFIGECKNYSKSLNVTYVGKFYSLMKSTNISFGIIFTQHGLTGTSEDFKDAYGLVKVLKIMEDLKNPDKKFYILTFTREDYQKMIEGHNFFELVEAKKLELTLHANYNSFIPDRHEATDEINSIISTLEVNNI